MAYAITHHFPNGNEEQYQAALASVHPSDGSLPAGQTYHAAGPTEDGWMIVAVFNSKDDWERFRDEDLLPGLQNADGAFEGQPQQTAFEVANLQQA
jgi:hypothetical protein